RIELALQPRIELQPGQHAQVLPIAFHGPGECLRLIGHDDAHSYKDALGTPTGSPAADSFTSLAGGEARTCGNRLCPGRSVITMHRVTSRAQKANDGACQGW